jgi:phospholipid-binding lipoprotein MlaA
LFFATQRFSGQIRTGLLLAVLLVLSACVAAPRATEINDPNELRNRKVHAFNKGLDQALVKPTATAYGIIMPRPVERGVDNFAANLSLPGMVLNDMLQLNIEDAFSNLARFTLNSTIGVAGLIDVATQNGLPEKPTDFGETLNVWGVAEGAYVELPVFGPSTTRDTVGLLVDFIIDPAGQLLPSGKRWLSPTAYVLNKVGDRNKYSDLVDSVLYESEDSYAQSRLLYLQNRRNELYGGISDADLEDPYADF